MSSRERKKKFEICSSGHVLSAAAKGRISLPALLSLPFVRSGIRVAEWRKQTEFALLCLERDWAGRALRCSVAAQYLQVSNLYILK
jgi:hypothetical protein